MRLLAFIPTKAQSSRIHGKNLLAVGGVPLVARAVRVALEGRFAGIFDDVVLSTDSRQVFKYAGAIDVHWPTKGRRYEGGVRDVLADFLAGTACQGACTHSQGPWDAVCVLWPTSPLRTLRHLTESLALLDEADVVMSVVPFRQNPKWALVEQDGLLHLSTLYGHPDAHAPLVRHCGTALWVKTSALPSLAPSFYGGRIAAYPMDPMESVDVDTPLDAAFAEFLLQRKGEA